MSRPSKLLLPYYCVYDHRLVKCKDGDVATLCQLTERCWIVFDELMLSQMGTLDNCTNSLVKQLWRPSSWSSVGRVEYCSSKDIKIEITVNSAVSKC